VTVRPPQETLAAEILPLLECCRFLERRTPAVLRGERRGGRASVWLRGVDIEVLREPYGVVLVVGPGNYGLMLAGIQTLHALAAGNAVIVKPAPGARAVLERFRALLVDARLPPDCLAIADEAPATAHALLACRVDKLVFTGSSAAGRDLLAAAAANLIPATVELSGWDACVVLDDADLARAAEALAFALDLNAGKTCLAPRRVIATPATGAALESRLAAKLARAAAVPFDDWVAARLPALVDDALRKGARIVAGGPGPRGGRWLGPFVLADVTPAMTIFRTEIFGPIALLVRATSVARAVDLANDSEFALGAAVFGSEAAARVLLRKLDAGVVMVNDVVVPAGHAELPLAARGASGFGATRGREGLLAMTRPKAVAYSRAATPPHLAASAGGLAPLLEDYARAAYGRGIVARLKACVSLVARVRSNGLQRR
jgi:acyl-CoA reductase-like NAD-dependent aldehyde dehydrogenase